MDSRFEQLLDAYFEGRLTVAEKAELQHRLRTDAAARQAFWAAAHWNSSLRMWGRERAGREDASRLAFGDGADHAEAPAAPAPRSSATQTRRRPVIAWAAVALAACLTLIATLYWPRTPASAPLLARITYAENARWHAASDAVHDRVLVAGNYDLEEGIIRLETEAGAIVSLAAPARFRLLAADQIEMSSGRLTARMLRDSSRLTVKVGDMVVEDLGTAFGIDANQADQTLVSVFDGKVAVTSRTSPGSELTVSRGQSLINRGGDALDPAWAAYDVEQFRDLWPLTVGINDASRLVEFLPPGPLLRPLRDYRASDHLFLFPEQQGVPTDRRLMVDLAPGAPSWPESPVSPYPIEAGVAVNSYLVFYQPAADKDAGVRHLKGTIEFQRPILGVICSDQGLNASDRTLGVNAADYGTPGERRGLEEANKHNYRSVDLPHDSLRIGPDGRTLHFDFHVAHEREQMRVLVAAH